jgi:hypothetical protein
LNVKQLMLGAGFSAALLGGIAAPLAHAGPFPEQAPCQSSGNSPMPGASPGEGFLMTVASDENAPVSCSFKSTGLPLTYHVAGLSAWDLTISHTVGTSTTTQTVASSKQVIDGGAPATGTATPAAGDVVTLTANPSCDPANSQCGTVLTATVGSS